MALATQTSNELVVLFDENVQNKTRQIYQAIPGSLNKFLEQRGIVKKVKFQQNFEAAQNLMGTKKKVNFADFERVLRNTILESFNADNVTELRAEDISAQISSRYQNETPSRADPGENVSAIIRFNQTFSKKDGDFWTNVNAYVYIYIEEECENNWFAKDKRRFSYEMTIELNGIAVNKDKAIKFSQMVATKPVEEAIQYIGTNFALTWNEI
jgi:hypothetical protein